MGVVLNVEDTGVTINDNPTVKMTVRAEPPGEAAMLSRIAESLFWIGRYVERADDTARILDVTVHQLLEDSSVDPDQASRTLLKVLGIEPPKTELDLWSLTDLVAFSRDTQGGCGHDQEFEARYPQNQAQRHTRRGRCIDHFARRRW